MGKTPLSFRIPDDTEQRLEEYRGDEVSKSDAARRLLERGLDAEQDRRGGPSLSTLFLLTFGAVLLSLATVLALLPVMVDGVALGETLAVVVALTLGSVVASVAAARSSGQRLVETVAKGVGA
jgi:hypothetical protein